MVALREEKFKDCAAMLFEALGRRVHFHAFFHGCYAGRQKLIAALDLDQAKAARTHIAEAVKVTEGRNVNVVFLGYFQNGLASATAYIFAVNYQGFYVNS